MISKDILEYSKINYVFKINDYIIGNILIEETKDVINIVDVLVNEEYRRNKVATRLLEEIIKDYKGKKEKIMLEVRSSNTPAINLYEKFGFKTIFVRKNYYKDDDALIMEVML